MLTKAPQYFPAHLAHWGKYRADGTLQMIGTFADPRDGAMAGFTSREAAEQFATTDPFVLNGVVHNWYIREWNEAISQS